jgi:hypothetical protein
VVGAGTVPGGGVVPDGAVVASGADPGADDGADGPVVSPAVVFGAEVEGGALEVVGAVLAGAGDSTEVPPVVAVAGVGGRTLR